MSTLGIVLIVLLILILAGGHFGAGWGYGPTGLLGAVLLILIILLLLGKI